MTTSPLPFASIQNEFLQVDYLTTTGPRIVGLYAKGVEGNLLAESPDSHWSTPYGEYYLRGGHRLWIAPEDPLYTCPEKDVEVIAKEDKITLRSDVDASGLEKEISFHLDKNRVVLTHRVTWHGKEPLELAPWAITQLRLGSMAVLPQPRADGILPDRNLVLWPYSQVQDQRLRLHDDLILIDGCAAEQALKVGNYNTHGWAACLLGNALFVKRFSVEPIDNYPDMGCNVEVYVKNAYIELETLGPLATLQPKESVTHEETWEVTPGEYLPTLENARMISRLISPIKMNGVNSGKQDYIS